MLFAIKSKSSKRLVSVNGQSVFESYDEARNAIRRKLRLMVKAGKVPRTVQAVGFYDDKSRSPTKTTTYFRIVRV